jgi:hypothetical protein
VNLDSSSDVNDEARKVEPLQVAQRQPQPRRLEMPSMSDGELYARLGVPDGLENNGTQERKFISASTDEHRNPSESVIRQEAD